MSSVARSAPCPPIRTYGVRVEDQRIEDPALQQALRAVSGIAQHSRTLFINEESKTEKSEKNEKSEEPPDLPTLSRGQLIALLIECGGNISAAARALSIHRTQLRRMIERQGVDPNKLRDRSRAD